MTTEYTLLSIKTKKTKDETKKTLTSALASVLKMS